MSYSDDLYSPQWREKRQQILDRDNHTCQRCLNEDEDFNGELHVHHQVYFPGRKPWDYGDHELITLCEKCHSMLHYAEELVRNRLNKAILWQVVDQWKFLNFINHAINQYLQANQPTIYPYKYTDKETGETLAIVSQLEDGTVKISYRG